MNVDFGKKAPVSVRLAYDGRGRWTRVVKRKQVSERLVLDLSQVGRQWNFRSDTVMKWQWVIRSAISATEVDVFLLCRAQESVMLLYQQADGKPSLQRVWLNSTAMPRWGGVRWWWHCPRCGRRCRILYGLPFFCRRCHGLTYASTQSGRGSAGCG